MSTPSSRARVDSAVVSIGASYANNVTKVKAEAEARLKFVSDFTLALASS